MARMNAAPKGAKKRPCNPVMVRTGRNTSATMNDAYTTALRTSSEASSTTRKTPCVLPGGAGSTTGAPVSDPASSGFCGSRRVGDGQAAEGHRVDGHSEMVEHDHRSQQRQRNRGERDEGRAQVQQEQKEHDADQQRAQQQRRFHVANRVFDKRGGPVQSRHILNS